MERTATKLDLFAWLWQPLVRVSVSVTGLACVASLFVAASANAQSTITKGIDTYVTSAAKIGPDGFYGEETAFEWDGSDGGGFNQALLYFDISQDFLDAFAAGSNQKAILKLHNVDSGSTGEFHRMTVNWLEGDEGGNFVSFNSIPGGPGIIPGENAQEISNLSTGDMTSGLDYEFDVTADVLAWAGGEPNYGWGILPGGGGGNGNASFEDEVNPSPSLELFGLLLLDGDFNGDGATDIADFNIMASNFYTEGTFADGDFDFNGQIDLLDFIGFRRAFRLQGQPAAASVPEPSSVFLLSFLGLWLLGRRRRLN